MLGAVRVANAKQIRLRCCCAVYNPNPPETETQPVVDWGGVKARPAWSFPVCTLRPRRCGVKLAILRTSANDRKTESGKDKREPRDCRHTARVCTSFPKYFRETPPELCTSNVHGQSQAQRVRRQRRRSSLRHGIWLAPCMHQASFFPVQLSTGTHL